MVCSFGLTWNSLCKPAQPQTCQQSPCFLPTQLWDDSARPRLADFFRLNTASPHFHLFKFLRRVLGYTNQVSLKCQEVTIACGQPWLPKDLLPCSLHSRTRSLNRHPPLDQGPVSQPGPQKLPSSKLFHCRGCSGWDRQTYCLPFLEGFWVFCLRKI